MTILAARIAALALLGFYAVVILPISIGRHLFPAADDAAELAAR